MLIEEPALPAKARHVGRGTPTALHLAASVGDVKKLRAVLSAGAVLLDAGDTHEYTALHVACASGHAKCVAALIGHEA